MKNYSLLFSKVSTWLRDSTSLLFIHIFCHRTMPYHFEQDDGWMAQNFFSGGTMPCHDLFLHFQQDVVLERLWWVNGRHYAQTCEDWLKKQDKNNKGGKAVNALREDAVRKGSEAIEGEKTFYRFRVFYLACAEFFGELGIARSEDSSAADHHLFSCSPQPRTREKNGALVTTSSAKGLKAMLSCAHTDLAIRH